MHVAGLLPVFGIPRPDGLFVIAGPCSAESRAQTLLTAESLAREGVKVFRAGVWKPRTKPGGFEGRGVEALEWLREVKGLTGMMVATEVATPAHLRAAVEAGVDGVWIGARTSANPFAVQEIADAFASLSAEVTQRLTVLIKNPVNPDIELWIGAIERLYGAGCRRLGAIHRGFSSYGPHLYRNRPRWAIPIELMRRIPELPVFFDPSHVAGRARLVPRLAGQAADMDYYGLMVEVHCNPAEALSDAAQQLTPAQFADLLHSLEKRDNTSSSESLEDLRRKIDSIDDRLLDLVSERMAVAREIGEYKRRHRLPVLQPARYNALMEERGSDAVRLGLDPGFVRSLLAVIHEESVKQQIRPDLESPDLES